VTTGTSHCSYTASLVYSNSDLHTKLVLLSPQFYSHDTCITLITVPTNTVENKLSDTGLTALWKEPLNSLVLSDLWNALVLIMHNIHCDVNLTSAVPRNMADHALTLRRSSSS